MELKIIIRTDTFENDLNQLQKFLNIVVEKIEYGGKKGNLFDINGNRVGGFKLE